MRQIFCVPQNAEKEEETVLIVLKLPPTSLSLQNACFQRQPRLHLAEKKRKGLKLRKVRRKPNEENQDPAGLGGEET
jgi:hypothetical protein